MTKALHMPIAGTAAMLAGQAQLVERTGSATGTIAGGYDAYCESTACPLTKSQTQFPANPG